MLHEAFDENTPPPLETSPSEISPLEDSASEDSVSEYYTSESSPLRDSTSEPSESNQHVSIYDNGLFGIEDSVSSTSGCEERLERIEYPKTSNGNRHILFRVFPYLLDALFKLVGGN